MVARTTTSLLLAVAGLAAAQQDFIIRVQRDIGHLGQPAPSVLNEALARCGAATTRRYNHALVGAAAALTPEQHTCISSTLGLAVEPDAVATKSESWSIDRLDGKLDYIFPQPPPESQVFPVYVLDTGVDRSHPYLSGRMSSDFKDIIDPAGSAPDIDGHGTHCAGIVSGSGNIGVSQATIIAVKVLDDTGSGTYAGVIEGVDWVVDNCLKRTGGSGRCVASMSLGGPRSRALNDAITNATASGLLFAVAAGNSRGNACAVSPASTAAAITVGATDITDNHATYSNYGCCVDIYAPGSAIVSARSTQMRGEKGDLLITYSGTSMATPYVAGLLSNIWSLNPGYSSDMVRQTLYSQAVEGSIKNMPGDFGARNLLAQGSGGGSSVTNDQACPLPPPPPPRSPGVAASCW